MTSGDEVFTFLDDEVLVDGMIVSFRKGRFDGPEGEFHRDIVRHPGAVSVVAVDGDDVFLVRQYRAPIDDWLWEIPAGKKDVVGEAPELTAERELAEEVGMRAGRLEHLIDLHHSPGFCDEFQNVFLATELTDVGRRVDSIEEQYMEVRRVRFAEAIAMATDGRITDGKSIIGILAAARRLGR
ncbi:MAG: NUDIX domain-containing protein [Acidimicrobiales bacterium]